MNVANIDISDTLRIATFYNSLVSGYIFKKYQISSYNWLDKTTIDKCMRRMESFQLSNNSVFEEYHVISDTPELQNKQLCGIIDCRDCYDIYEFKCTNKLEKIHYIQLALYMYIIESGKPHRYYINTNNTIKRGIQNIKINDKITYIHKKKLHENIITSINKLSIKVGTKKAIKIHRKQIIRNLSYSEKPNIYKYYLCNILNGHIDGVACNMDGLKNIIKIIMGYKYGSRGKLSDEEFIIKHTH